MKISKLKEYAKKLLAFCFGAISIVMLSACGNADVKACKNAKFDIDTTRTLEQAFKDNPEIKETKWEAIEKDGKKFVQVTFTFNDEPALEKLKKDKDNDAAMKLVYRVLVVSNSIESSLLFAVPEKKDGQFELVKATTTPSKDKALSAAKSVAKKMEKIGVNADAVKKMQEEMTKEINAARKKEFKPRESTSERELKNALECIYKTKSDKSKNDSSDKIKAMNAAKQIVTAWQTYAKSSEPQRMINAKDIHEWAFRLCEKADLNEPSFWILDCDPFVAEKIGSGATMPAFVGNKIGNEWKISEEFKSFPLSWEVANKIQPNAPAKTPIIWTRGLKSTGLWDKDEGVFGDKGGIIGFADGTVKWFDSLRDDENPKGALKVYGGTRETFNIGQAINGGWANILKSQLE